MEILLIIILSFNDLLITTPNSGLIFRRTSGTGEVYLYPYPSDPTYNYINATGTLINFPIPTTDFFGSASPGYYEGEIIVRSGPYISAPFPIRINY